MYNALNWPDYNLETRALMRRPDSCRVTVATDILMVGVDVPDIDDIVIVSHPPNVNNYLQKVGRTGRDRTIVSNPCGIVYSTTYARKVAHDMLGIELPTTRPKKVKVESKPPNKPRERRTKKRKIPDTKTPTSKSSMSEEMAKLIVSKCKTAELDSMYRNPPLQPSTHCNCSGCVQKPEMPQKPQRRRPKGEVQLSLTKEMKELVTEWLIGLREEIYLTADSKMLTDPFLILPRLVPGGLISKITRVLLQLTWETLGDLIGENPIMKVHTQQIWTTALELQSSFRQQLKQKAEEKEHQKRCVYVWFPGSADPYQRGGVQMKRQRLLGGGQGTC